MYRTKKGTAALLSVSERQISNLDKLGLMPRPVVIPGVGKQRLTKRWCEDELRAWLKAGSPPRSEWEARAQ